MPTSESESNGGLRAQVLLVDDEVEHTEVMAESLRRPGHVCTIVKETVCGIGNVGFDKYK